MASCRDCPCDSASCRDSRQKGISYGQSLQEAIYQEQQSRQEARDRGQSRRKRKLVDAFMPCEESVSFNTLIIEIFCYLSTLACSLLE